MRNKTIKFAAIALLSVFALTACDDDIIAKPTGYGDNSPIANIEGFNGTVYNNNLTDIYDSMRSGNVPTDVLDLLLYQYSMSVFGNYNKVTAATVSNNSFGEISLKQAVKDITETKQTVDGKEVTTYSGGDKAKAFVKAHKAYWNKDKDGNRVKDDLTTPAGENDDPTSAEYARVVGKWNTIEKRIAQKMYSEISGGSYSEENVFEEAKFLRSLGGSIENKVAEVNDTVKANAFIGVLTPEVEDYDVFVKPSKKLDDTEDVILHREYYQTSAASDEDKEAGENDATYIEDKIIPDIYRQLLVEQYILDKSYDTLGRTSARQISVLAIKKNSKYAKGAVDLMNTFVKDVIFDENRTDEINLDTFKTVSNAWVGAFMSEDDFDQTAEYDLISKAIPEYEVLKDTDNDGVGDKPIYFKGTAYGDMMEEIEKISNNPSLSENEGTYTGGNTYSVEVGKEIKTRELQLNDYTSTGWYVKSVGASSLPDSLKNQLFDINVANALNGEACVEYEKDGNEWTTNVDKEQAAADYGKISTKYINVVGKIKGQYFLRNTSRIAGNPVENDILFESDGTYYVVLVEDAIRSKNLDKRNQTELDVLEERINEIVQIIGNNDTYKNLSKKHWLEEMNLKYHDTEVYTYFKTNFPELFDDQS